MEKQTSPSCASCSTPSDCRRQDWADMSDDFSDSDEEHMSRRQRQVPQDDCEDFDNLESEVDPNSRHVVLPGSYDDQTTWLMDPSCLADATTVDGEATSVVSWPVVEVRGLPRALCTQKNMEVVLEQALLGGLMVGYWLQDKDGVSIMLNSWPAATYCYNHFANSSWPTQALKVTMGATLVPCENPPEEVERKSSEDASQTSECEDAEKKSTEDASTSPPEEEEEEEEEKQSMATSSPPPEVAQPEEKHLFEKEPTMVESA